MFSPIRLDANNPGPMTGRGNNTYLLAGDQAGVTLVDAGVGEPRHLAALDHELSVRHARLERVLVTHAHGDHASGAPALAAAHATAKFYKFPSASEDAKYDVPWIPLADDQEIDAAGEPLVAMLTAGHSPDHLIFWHARSRTAFTGDLVAKGSSVMIEWSRGGDLGKYLRALERLLAMNPTRLLPAHGPEIDDPATVLTSYLEHRHMRERQVLEALAADRRTVQAITESIYDGLSPALVPAAMENVRAHLEKLRQEGRAIEHDARWTTT